MSKRTRFKFAIIAFFTFIACAVLKHWLEGLDVQILIIGAVPTLAYILGETFRPSA
jgi:hypothetical protein